jgi:nucleotide-binding universal stress UspA family protein
MYQRILVPFDGSATSSRGLDEAIRLASLTGATLRIVHLVDDLAYATGFETFAVYANDVLPLMRQAGARVLQAGKSRAEKAGVQVETQLLEGSAIRLADTVAEQVKAWHADLVVIGTHGRRGVGRLLLGSDAEQIVRTAPVPVLLVRGQADAPAS